MERDLGNEIDQLREEMSDLKRMLAEQSKALQTLMKEPADASLMQQSVSGHAPEPKEGHIQKMPFMHPAQSVRAVLDELENDANSHGSSGRVTYIGTYESGGNQSTWIQHSIDVDPLLQQIEDGSAARVLACIGSNDRLRLLLALLRKPMTVQQMVAECGFNTTGQVYNHLRSLIAVDLVAEDEHGSRGTYAVVPHRVSGLIMLLAGVRDLLDSEFTQADYSGTPSEQ